jgi:uridine phosphorylase
VFDPDGDLVDYLQTSAATQPHPTWACYHTSLATFLPEGVECGILGRVVGAPFAVLVAEELFASGCQLLISITWAGQIAPIGHPPYVVLIDLALRDEGTSYHDLPPLAFSSIRPDLHEALRTHWDHPHLPLHIGASWTTDAPFRETAAMIEGCRQAGILAVEMEAAALDAVAETKQYDIVCFALVTNQMGRSEEDFEKGEASGSQTLLHIIGRTIRIWRSCSKVATGQCAGADSSRPRCGVTTSSGDWLPRDCRCPEM